MEVRSQEEILDVMSWGMIGWYDFNKNGKSLFIGNPDDPIISFFEENDFLYDVIGINEISAEWSARHKGEYSEIICVSCLEEDAAPVRILGELYKVLCEGGHLLFGINNRLGIRYFCGDVDPYTGRSFDGIDGYVSGNNIENARDHAHSGRCYSRGEICDMLDDAGWKRRKFYAVFPGLRDASFLFAEDYTPKEDLSARIFPSYFDAGSVFLQEQALYPILLREGLFHGMANAYLIECVKSGELSDVLQVSASLDRGKKDAFYTVIRADNIVEKRPAYPEGNEKIAEMHRNNEDLRTHGIKVVDSRIENGKYVMPYIKSELAHTYLKELLFRDEKMFLTEMDRFRKTVLQSSAIKWSDDGTEVYEKGYFDLVPLNCFHIDGTFAFFDQEFCVKDLPVKVLTLRQIASLYFGDPQMEKKYPKELLYQRYDLLEELPRWQKIEWDYLNRLLNNGVLRSFHASHRTDPDRIRKRRNATDRRFMNLFDNVRDRKLFLFGSGKYADRFLDRFEGVFPIHGIIDNAPEKQGTKKRGISIISPNELLSVDDDSLKIIVCMKDYASATAQLREMGILDYGIYDPALYDERDKRNRIRIESDAADAKTAKPYHLGYCAGAFDMFHIGHLNLLRRAKERCDILIVGVMSDERMYDLKKKYPVIPCNERMQVVAGCRYVDRVEELPADRAGIMDAWNMFHFDCMFSGDDHENDPGWLAERERLREKGSDIVFVSYTKETSSSAIREKAGL